MSGASYEVAVIGGGIAGVSVAAPLAAAGARVVLLEAERTLAFHTTGRSAALFFQNYGHPAVRALSTASRRFFESPPDQLADGPLLSPRGALMVSDRPENLDGKVSEGSGLRRLDTAATLALVPALRPERVAGAVFEPDAADMDVAAIHQAFVRLFRRAGGDIVTGRRVLALRRRGTTWTIGHGGDDTITASTVVDAAGAWADVVAEMADARTLGVVPKRRTAFMVPAPTGSDGWPLVFDVDETWYFKPDGPQLLCSPADQTPSPPVDARPDEIDVALAIDRINLATTLDIRTVRSSWAGLRTFTPDGGMAIGYDPEVDGFFWLAGQGGTGIQTAPAAGRLAAALVTGAPVPEDLAELGFDPAAVDPARFR